MTAWFTRTNWQARERRSATPLEPAGVEGIALHWPGMAKPINAAGGAGYDRVASALRGWQDYHMDGRGWSDIAYQAAVDQAGRAWTLRGLSTRSGANGDADVNRRFGALLLVLAPGEEPSSEMILTVRAVIAEFRMIYPKGTKIVPHSAVRPEPTDCPGDLARACIVAGRFTPNALPVGGHDMTPEQFETLMKAQNAILTELRGINARMGYVANDGMKDLDEIRDVMKPGQDG